MKFLFISVIIPTYNRIKDLEECLVSIVNQNYPKDKYEIIVVDQGTDGIEKLIRKYEIFENIKFILETKISLSIARKVGVENSIGDIIAYIDDDAIADKDWLFNLSKGYDDPYVAIVGGKVLPIWSKNAKKIHKKKFSYTQSLFSLFNLGEKEKIVPYVIGVNFSVRKKIFKEFGFFDENIGRKGLNLLGGEETEFCERVGKKYNIKYSPSANVYHKILDYRLRINWLISRAYYGGLSKAIQGRMPNIIQKINLSWFDYFLIISYGFGYIIGKLKKFLNIK